MKNSFKIILASGLLLLSLNSCKKEDLNLKPTNDVTADDVYATPAGYKNSLVKLYATYALTSPSGSDNSDVGGLNAGFADFFRLFWTSQELTTDEAICAWGDVGIPELNYSIPSNDNQFLRGLYSRSLLQITFCNEFLRESTPEKLASRNITGADATAITRYRAEARFLRAFQYWVLLDAFGNPPFVTEDDNIGKVAPKQIQRAALFSYVESELKAIEGDLADARTNDYGRADKGADWALLARLYLNAQVYTGTAKYTEAITYSSKVIASSYFLKDNYMDLFKADNDKNNTENILTINYDGVNGTNYGGTTFLINAAINADMLPATYGVPNGGWSGNRTRQNLPALFPDVNGTADKRGVFFGTKNTIDDVGTFTDGLRVTKFKNVTSGGTTPASLNGVFSSMDFALFRLAEQYLIYGEAVARGGSGGSAAQALTYVNALRFRAYGNTSGNVSAAALTTDFYLDERGRELYWEGHRRTDLVRFGKYAGSTYLWPYKGGVKAGASIPAYRNIFALPTADLIANPNLVQNTGY
ncbi:putative outer membrane starch-binding protein [Pedobacter psychrotolerans]|uniref:Membrane protein n=1 Tax=Pedobacter psychrotolerans TaxID=1843235 RepID=A0A4R2HAB2_9SPHI|nr:RagB/SusD family nutrient uptake outer membrane protein [Pedobacter psychrotolerans]TCO23642.1 putative outer membrane starch-binding protein [Pedobacter psychrotolerans]GGE61516.1 membrane protein [Pedobacter psychrotolerans]